jgi:hypothetical protein
MSVTLTLIQKQTNVTINPGQPIGLLLLLTYATTVNSGLTVNLISKN